MYSRDQAELGMLNRTEHSPYPHALPHTLRGTGTARRGGEIAVSKARLAIAR